MSRDKTKTAFLCGACGADFPKWHGQCPACHEWGTLSEFQVREGRRRQAADSKRTSVNLQEVLSGAAPVRLTTGIGEVDRVLGGGLLQGSLVLLGGSPGIGKSTLALQLLARIPGNLLYVSAEESQEQIALRARRLGVDTGRLNLSGENCLEEILEQIQQRAAGLVVIDSIQTVYSQSLDSLPGSLSQIRECGQQLLQTCKQSPVTVMVIGHVTKEGLIAGPKMLEHMVDTVLYLEGDERYDQRILRATKNRFGTTNEVGIFRMEREGLVEVPNPSELFLSERSRSVSGTTIYPAIEGSRPILVEVQALVSAANFGTPQRNVNGINLKRLAMLLAVLEKRLGQGVSTRDVFVNLVGGLSIQDPAVDLAVISAVASSILDRVIPEDTVLVGEVGLAGEVRSVAHLPSRVKEAETLGFTRLVAPARSAERLRKSRRKLRVQGVHSVREAFELLF